jgi:prepilin-type N-terminal cleavage/methylation domain-containing protein
MNFSHHNPGYTLIEMIVAMAIFGVLVAMSGDYIINSLRATKFHAEQETAIQEARRGVENFTREVRGANSSERGDYALGRIEDDDVVFYTDVDYDDQMDRVRYFHHLGTLYRVVTPPGPSGNYQMPTSTSTISIYVTNDAEPIFTFYDNDYNETSLKNEVRLIKMILVINVTDRAPNEYYLESDVHLRNLKDNL